MNIVLVAGEASGDQLGAALIDSLRQRFPEAIFHGVGGLQMLSKGQAQWFGAEELAVMGLFEVLRHLPRLLGLRRQVIQRTFKLAPDLFIGIDAPDFNLPIAKRFKDQGLRCVHYVSPSIWAWRQGRAKKIARATDLLLCLFPFEPELYAAYGLNAKFVGHPLADQFPDQPSPLFARTTLGIPLAGPILALLPGSRSAEVSALGKDFLDAGALLKSKFPKLTIIAPMASQRARQIFGAQLQPHHSVLMLEGQAQLALQAADAVIVASGTAALEAALARKPMVVAYRLNRFTYWLARSFGLLKSQFFSLPNKLADKEIVPELEQDGVTPTALAKAIEGAFESGPDSAQQQAFADLHAQLRCNASERAAEAIAELLSHPVA
jgi:lipid-A-disaccharide synthase